MIRWEYDTLTLYDYDDFPRCLDEVGNDGWELVSVVGVKTHDFETTVYKCFLKRPYFDVIYLEGSTIEIVDGSTIEITDEDLENLKIGGTD